MSTRLRTLAILVALVLVVLVGLWLVKKRPSTKPKVGAILALTGKADYIGKPERDVLQALLSDFNAHSDASPGIDLDVRDTGGDPNRARTIFEELAKDDKVLAIIGPSTSGESIAIAGRANEARIPLLSLAASRQIVIGDDGKVRPWVFKFAQNDDLAAQRLVLAMTNNKHLSVALLYSDDAFGKSGADAFRKAAMPDGGPKLLNIQYDSAYSSSITQPESIIAGVPETVQAVLIWGTSPGPALLIKELKRVGRNAQVYLSHGNASPDFIANAGPSAEGAIVIGSRVLLSQTYLSGVANDPIKRYQDFWAKHFGGGLPSHFGGHARDALEALANVLRNGAKTRGEIRDRIEELKYFQGVTGTFTFSPDDHAGLDSSAFETYTIKNGGFVPLDKAK